MTQINLNSRAIFLHAGLRTGGSALAFSFRNILGFELLFDPLSPVLENIEDAFTRNTDQWKSNHAPHQSYFEELKSHVVGGRIPNYNAKYFNDYFGGEYPQEFVNYIESLITNSNSRNLIPVMKFETTEGRIELLKTYFPNCLNIAITRDIEDQETSWLEQLSLGNPVFFEGVSKIINTSPSDFGLPAMVDLNDNKISTKLAVFQAYEFKRRKLLEFCDFQLDMTDSDTFLKSLSKAKAKSDSEYFPWARLQQNYLAQPPKEKCTHKLKSAYLQLISMQEENSKLKANSHIEPK